MFTLRQLSIITTAFFVIYILILPSCNRINRNGSHPEISDQSIQAGKKLASVYCQSCHLLPDPSLLDSKSWEKGVLPRMGPLLGIYELKYQRYPANLNDRNLKGYYPSKPLLKIEEWQDLLNYYIATSPDSLIDRQKNLNIKNTLPLFAINTPSIKYDAPSISLVKIDSAASHPLIAADLFKKTIYRFNKDVRLIDSMQFSGEVVDIEFQKEGMLTCNIGIFNPTNEKYGEARFININKNGKMQKEAAPLFDKLTRPVQISSVDLNNDGKEDYLVCEFGYITGALSWMENLGNGKFDRHVIRALPGAVKAYIEDYNHDGLQDLWVLFTQGNEGIFLFTNKGNGKFEEKQVLRFPPVYGSSYFEFADFNKDGRPDIVYTCGDNADFSTVLKPYHGVYIFINDGGTHFKQRYFFHINGCYKAIARDFDNDGDVDIAAISFFADYKTHPEEGFVYLNNTGSLNFEACTSPETQQGRWITMDAGDLDGDGKIDLVLGNFSHGPTMMRSGFDWKKGPPFIVLHNNGNK